MKRVLAVLAVLLILPSLANAGLMLDLTTADGGKVVGVVPGCSGSWALQLWAVVTGADGKINNEGIQSVYAWIKTSNPDGITGLTGITSQPTRASTLGAAVSDGTLSGGDLIGSTKATTWSAKTNAGTAIPPMTSLGGAAVPLAGEYKIADNNTVAILLGNITYNYAAVAGSGKVEINAQVPTWASSLNLAAVYGQDYAGTFTKVTNASQATVGAPVTLLINWPEPSTFILLATGALALVFIRRRKSLMF